MTTPVKCPATDCKKRDQCYLFTCIPLPKYQAWFTMACHIKDVDKCRFFKSNEEKDNEEN